MKGELPYGYGSVDQWYAVYDGRLVDPARRQPDKAIKMVLPQRHRSRRCSSRPARRRPTTRSSSGSGTDLKPRFDAINGGGGYTSADTALTVDNDNWFAEHDIVVVTRTVSGSASRRSSATC